jgi:hypothetical protein
MDTTSFLIVDFQLIWHGEIVDFIVYQSLTPMELEMMLAQLIFQNLPKFINPGSFDQNHITGFRNFK